MGGVAQDIINALWKPYTTDEGQVYSLIASHMCNLVLGFTCALKISFFIFFGRGLRGLKRWLNRSGPKVLVRPNRLISEPEELLVAQWSFQSNRT